MKIKELLQNFMYTILSNLVTMAISTLVILVVPKLLGVEEYGYIQLYLFYTTYVGMMHFGWIDGIYLRYGGENYQNLDKRKFNSQFYMLLIFQIILMIGVIIYSFWVSDPNKSYIWLMTAFCMLLTNMRQLIYIILQDTNRIKEYSTINIFDRLIYIVFLIVFLSFGVRDFKWLVFADIIGKVLSLGYAMFLCNDIVFGKLQNFYFDFKEMWINISVGIKLLFANFASLFIIGVIRLGVEYAWGVSVFGKVSLMLSISNLLMVFINAISLVLFPMLRRVEHGKLSSIYVIIREYLMVILFTGLFFYYPIRIFLPMWLPKYAESIKYMAILFPMVIYEGKFSLLVSTYMKTMRFEKLMMFANLISLAISIFLTLVGIYIFNSLDFLMFGIVFVLGFRSTFSEIILGKRIDISVTKELITETVVVLTFIISSWKMEFPNSLVIYFVIFIIYCLYKFKNLKLGFKKMQQFFIKD